MWEYVPEFTEGAPVSFNHFVTNGAIIIWRNEWHKDFVVVKLGVEGAWVFDRGNIPEEFDYNYPNYADWLMENVPPTPICDFPDHWGIPYELECLHKENPLYGVKWESVL